MDFSTIRWGNELSTEDYKQSFVPSESLTFSAKDGRRYDVSIVKSKDLTCRDLDACFNLIETYSRTDYEASQIGWNPPHKRGEMKEPDMRYLLVKEATISGGDSSRNEIVAFCSCMSTVEDAFDVIYIYELHTSEATRRTGLGRHLMSMVEHIGCKAGMAKAMLTVFTNNVGAEAFYRRLGYVESECSPTPKVSRSGKIRKPEYYIMEKGFE